MEHSELLWDIDSMVRLAVSWAGGTWMVRMQSAHLSISASSRARSDRFAKASPLRECWMKPTVKVQARALRFMTSLLPSSTLPQILPAIASSGLRNQVSHRAPGRKVEVLPKERRETPRSQGGAVRTTTHLALHIRVVRTSNQPAPVCMEAVLTASCQRKDDCKSGAWKKKFLPGTFCPGLHMIVTWKLFGNSKVGQTRAPIKGKQ
mmetsp:Transcript_65750/g.154754  ORF Transcript_65750/g.154754 Transcript_65750/m.154754 type:complete len:206 (+) Transcript_65750:1162-1779(+)